jgi:hypothetical protein
MRIRSHLLLAATIVLGLMFVPASAGLATPQSPTANAQQAVRPPQSPTPTPTILAPQPTPRPAEPAAQPINVKVDVNITDQAGTQQAFKKAISVTVADRQAGAIRSSMNVPTPSSTYIPATDKGAVQNTMMTWGYRAANLNLDVREISIEGNFIRLRLAIEFSPVDDKAVSAEMKPGTPGPSYASFQQTLSLVLENGKPLQVAQSSDAVPSSDRKLSVEVKATILR